MTQLKVVLGADRDWAIQCWLDGAITPALFNAGDTISAYVYQGQSEVQLFTLTTTWYTAGGTQTGYSQGQIQLTITAVNSATLEANGIYTVLVFWTPQGSSRNLCVWRGELLAEPSAGTSTQTVTPYCAYADMLRFANWVRDLENSDVDQEGFYTQRLEAREWMDWAITNNYRGSFVGLYEQHSTLAFEYGYAGWRRSLGPSPSLLTYLQQNLLIVRPSIIRATAKYAAYLVGNTQIGRNNLLAGYGALMRDEALYDLCGTTAEVDLNGDGIGELFINLASTNTLYT